MKNHLWLFPFLLTTLFVLTMSACNRETDAYLRQQKETLTNPSWGTNTLRENSNTTKYLDSSAFPILLEESSNHQLFSDEQLSGYYYKVFDNSESILEEGFLSWRFFFFFQLDENILMMRTGSGGALSSVKLYDVEGGRISCLFPGFLGHSDYLIAYFDVDAQGVNLIIQDMFDTDRYYYKITDNSLTEKVFFTTECSAEFSHNNTFIKLTYPNGVGETASKTFPLDRRGD